MGGEDEKTMRKRKGCYTDRAKRDHYKHLTQANEYMIHERGKRKKNEPNQRIEKHRRWQERHNYTSTTPARRERDSAKTRRKSKHEKGMKKRATPKQASQKKKRKKDTAQTTHTHTHTCRVLRFSLFFFWVFVDLSNKKSYPFCFS